MKKLLGTPINIDRTILGKITRKTILGSSKKDFILIGKDKYRGGYGANILERNPTNSRDLPLLYDVKDLEQLKDGDVVSVAPDGTINVLYEKESYHNCLMITERCNYSCVMCPQPKVPKEEDRTPLNLKLISLMDKDAKCLGLSGGEPTLLGDRLLDIIQTCKNRLPKTALTLLTNGMLFNDLDYAKKLTLIHHPDLQIDIPLYSDTDTEHNRIIGANGFYKTIEGLYNLALLEQKIGIRIVVHKMNYHRLPQLAEFIYRNFPFVFHIAFMQMETIGLAKENIEKLWIDPYDYNKELEKAITYLDQRCMNVSIYNGQLCVLPKSLWKYARKSISSWKNIYIDECNKCDYKEKCGGFFESSLEKHSKHIKALVER